MKRSRSIVAALFLCAGFAVAFSPAARADFTSRAAVNASPAQLGAIPFPYSLPIIPTGANVRVALLEADGMEEDPANPGNFTIPGHGVPQLNGPNTNMPAAGADINNRVQILTPIPVGSVATSHATIVAGVMMDNASGMARQMRLQAANSATVGGGFTNTQNMLRTNTTPGATTGNATIINLSLGLDATLAQFNAAPPNRVRSDGNNIDTQFYDWAAITQAGHPIQNKLMVIAGNEDRGTDNNGNKLGGVSPQDSFNGLVVGATTRGNYRTLASYNGRSGTFAAPDVIFNGDPYPVANTQNLTHDRSNYHGELNNRREGRFNTHIVAPGGGGSNDIFRNGALTGIDERQRLNDPVRVGSVEDNAGDGGANNDGLNSSAFYGGTSFAAPHVTAAAAMLTELGTYRGFQNQDHKVLRAVLMNGASKDVSHWNRGGDNAWRPRGALTGNDGNPLQKGNAAANPTVTQNVRIGWDEDLGTGLLDTGRSLVNYNYGEQNPGNVGLIGWDLNPITAGNFNEYLFTTPADGITQITATLAWDRLVRLMDNTGAVPIHRPNDLWRLDPNGDGNFADADSFQNFLLNDLDLEIWDRTTNTKVFFSNADMESIEHVFYDVPQALRMHQFSIRVNYFRNFNTNWTTDNYGLAWYVVPTPSTVVLLAFGGIFAARRRR